MKFYKITTLIALFILLNTQSNAQGSCWCSFLISFTATQQTDHTVKLHWETNTESLTAYDFVIERSYDGFSTSSDIGYITAHAGASSYSYDFYDVCPCAGSTTDVYYRLRSVNNNNSLRYSDIRHVSLSGCPTCASQCTLASLTGTSAFCSGSSQYEVVNSPGPVSWSVSNGSLASITNISSSAINLTKNGDGVITLTAAISGCTSFTKTIVLGTPAPTTINMTYQSSCMGGTDWDATFTPSPLPDGTTYLWSVNGSSYFSGSPYFNENYPLAQSSDPSITLNVEYQNSCGTSSPLSFPVTYYSPCGGFRATIAPNPIKDHVTIKIDEEFAPTNKYKKLSLDIAPFEVKLIGINDHIIYKYQKSTPGAKQMDINTRNLKPGIYIAEITYKLRKVTKEVRIN